MLAAVAGEFQERPGAHDVERGAPLGQFPAQDLDLSAGPGLDGHLHLCIPVYTLRADGDIGLCTQAGSDAQFRTYHAVDLRRCRHEQADAGLCAEGYLGTAEGELVLQFLELLDGAPATLIADAGLELVGVVVVESQRCLGGDAGVEFQFQGGVDGHGHGDDAYYEGVGEALELGQRDLALVIRQFALALEADGGRGVEAELTVDARLKLLDGGIRDEPLPLDAAVDGQEVVEFEVDGDLTLDVDRVLGFLAKGDVLVERDLVVERDESRMDRAAGAAEHILGGHVLVLTALCGAGLRLAGLIDAGNVVVLVIAVGVGELHHCGVDQAVVVDVLGGILGDVFVSSAGGYRGLVSVHVPVGGQLGILVADEFSGGDALHLQDIGVADELLLQRLAAVGQVAGVVPDAERVVHEVGDAQFVGQRLLHGDLRGVGVHNLHVVFTVEIVVGEAVRLKVGIVADLVGAVLRVVDVVCKLVIAARCESE